ncbi:MAG: hypothetical protein QY312_02295 [Candidatus Dojkabacteria bacterium]|nr:MAG: hypothetical protein QY312_02295 [Candidatus Dojkabacteria bacterium]
MDYSKIGFSVLQISIKNPLGSNSLTIWGVLINALNVILPIAGVLFVALFVYAGVSYMLSTGDPGKVKNAQAVMTNAVIGFLIVSFAFVGLRLIQRSIIGT